MKSILSNIMLLLMSMHMIAAPFDKIYDSYNCMIPCVVAHEDNHILTLGTKDDTYYYLGECGYQDKARIKEMILSADTFYVSTDVFNSMASSMIATEFPWIDSVLQNNEVEQCINKFGALKIPNMSQQEDDYMVVKAFYKGYLFTQDCETGLYVIIK